MRRGIPIRNPRDRGAEILADPDGYYRRAREEARRMVESDAVRERRREATAFSLGLLAGFIAAAIIVLALGLVLLVT